MKKIIGIEKFTSKLIKNYIDLSITETANIKEQRVTEAKTYKKEKPQQKHLAALNHIKELVSKCLEKEFTPITDLKRDFLEEIAQLKTSLSTLDVETVTKTLITERKSSIDDAITVLVHKFDQDGLSNADIKEKVEEGLSKISDENPELKSYISSKIKTTLLALDIARSGPQDLYNRQKLEYDVLLDHIKRIESYTDRICIERDIPYTKEISQKIQELKKTYSTLQEEIVVFLSEPQALPRVTLLDTLSTKTIKDTQKQVQELFKINVLDQLSTLYEAIHIVLGIQAKHQFKTIGPEVGQAAEHAYTKAHKLLGTEPNHNLQKGRRSSTLSLLRVSLDQISSSSSLETIEEGSQKAKRSFSTPLSPEENSSYNLYSGEPLSLYVSKDGKFRVGSEAAFSISKKNIEALPHINQLTFFDNMKEALSDLQSFYNLEAVTQSSEKLEELSVLIENVDKIKSLKELLEKDDTFFDDIAYLFTAHRHCIMMEDLIVEQTPVFDEEISDQKPKPIMLIRNSLMRTTPDEKKEQRATQLTTRLNALLLECEEKKHSVNINDSPYLLKSRLFLNPHNNGTTLHAVQEDGSLLAELNAYNQATIAQCKRDLETLCENNPNLKDHADIIEMHSNLMHQGQFLKTAPVDVPRKGSLLLLPSLLVSRFAQLYRKHSDDITFKGDNCKSGLDRTGAIYVEDKAFSDLGYNSEEIINVYAKSFDNVAEVRVINTISKDKLIKKLSTVGEILGYDDLSYLSKKTEEELRNIRDEMFAQYKIYLTTKHNASICRQSRGLPDNKPNCVDIPVKVAGIELSSVMTVNENMAKS